MGFFRNVVHDEVLLDIYADKWRVATTITGMKYYKIPYAGIPLEQLVSAPSPLLTLASKP